MLVQPAADTFTLVSKEPSPSNLVAVTMPVKRASPSTLSLYPFAVVPIPTPSSSIATKEVPEPTLKKISHLDYLFQYQVGQM